MTMSTKRTVLDDRDKTELQEQISSGGGGGSGEDGDSAYEIAVKNGFKGSEAEWLESLKGLPGATTDIQSIPADDGYVLYAQKTNSDGSKEDAYFLASIHNGVKGDKGDKGDKGNPESG